MSNTIKTNIMRVNYFENEKGDVTITLDDEPIAICPDVPTAVKLTAAYRSLTMRVDVLTKMREEMHNKIMVQWEKDFGSIHNDQKMDDYTMSGFIREVLKCGEGN